MKVLVACEESQRVCIEFRKLGHEAYSCDILECSGGHPEWHIQGDAINTMYSPGAFVTQDGTFHIGYTKWDLIIAHPPCTYLTVSGNRWFNIDRYGEKAIERIENRTKAMNFFMKFVNANCEKVAIENPIGCMSTYYRKPDQIIKPWMFGHGETKSTCLWLKGLPKLIPTNIVEGRKQRVWKMTHGPERTKERSKTYPGIAKAMAEQWGKEYENTRIT